MAIMAPPERYWTASRAPLQLRGIFSVVFGILIYCARNAGPLFVLAWFPCLIESASRLGLEALVFSHPARLPDWLLSPDFEPSTWLTAFVVTPWAAMAWAFVLSAMADRNSRVGAIATPAPSIHRRRLELGPAVLVAAAIFSAANLADGMLRFAERFVLLLADPELSDVAFGILGICTIVVHAAVMAVVMALSYPLAGQVLRGGTIGEGWQLLGGKILCIAAIFFLLTIILVALDRLLGPPKDWLVRLLTAPQPWSLQEATIRYVIDFPLSMLMIVVWAVAVGIVIDTPTQPASSHRRPRSS